MATEIMVTRGPGLSLMPLGEEGNLVVRNMKYGQAVKATIVQPRNVKFHRKLFALLNMGFDYWEPPVAEWRGLQAEKNFDVFREQVTILAGFREVTYNLDGSVKVKAKSISFANMDDGEFGRLYRAIFNVIWRMVISRIEGFTEEVMENTVNQLLSFEAAA